MNSNHESPARTSKAETYVQRQAQPWLRLPVFLVVAVVMITLSAVTALADSSSRNVWQQSAGTVPQPVTIYLGFKSSDEIEFDDDQEDFIYKNEDIVAFAPGTGEFSIYFDGSECGLTDANLDDFDILENGDIIFTLRSAFTIEGLGEVDDSDVIAYTPSTEGCGTFGYYVIGADVGLTQGEEDIDALGVDEDGSLVVSTIGTAAPTTTPADRPPLRKEKVFAIMLPASMSGIRSISHCPATGPSRPFTCAASRLTALSRPKGPSTTQCGIWPRRSIPAKAAASTVTGILGFTSSTAPTAPTRGSSTPKHRAR